MSDNNHKNCLLVRNHLRLLSIGGKTPLSSALPDSPEEYWDETLTGEARTEHRKAVSRGYKLEQVVDTPHQGLLEIMRSWEEKQGRKVNMRYNTIAFSNIDIKDKWPVDSYPEWCPKHNLSLFVVKNTEDRVVAYLELLRCDQYALVHSTMCHKNYIGDGVMKFMFIEVAKRLLGSCTHLLYGDTGALKDERKHFHKDMNILKPLTYIYREPTKTIVLDSDDLSIGAPGLEDFLNVKQHFPGMKVTFFMIPIPSSLTSKKVTVTEYKNWAKWLRDNSDWIEICPHGMTHAQSEMKYMPTKQTRLVDYDTANIYIDVAEHTFKQLELPFKKIWKSPYWESSPEVLRALWNRGYTIAVDQNQPEPYGGPIYKYNWSFEEPMPDFDLIKGHGHMYPPSKNAIQYTFNNLLKMPVDAEFKFISEVIL